MTVPASDGDDIDLLFDEMFSPAIAEALRGKGRLVQSVAERVDLRALADEDIYAWAAARSGCWILTENVKDFRPLMLQALQVGAATAGLLFTSSRTFPRSRLNPGPLIDAINAWLERGRPEPPLIEDWLQPLT